MTCRNSGDIFLLLAMPLPCGQHGSFFEYRSYGHQVNFPFDFLELKLKLSGATLKLEYLF